MVRYDSSFWFKRDMKELLKDSGYSLDLEKKRLKKVKRNKNLIYTDCRYL